MLNGWLASRPTSMEHARHDIGYIRQQRILRFLPVALVATAIGIVIVSFPRFSLWQLSVGLGTDALLAVVILILCRLQHINTAAAVCVSVQTVLFCFLSDQHSAQFFSGKLVIILLIPFISACVLLSMRWSLFVGSVILACEIGRLTFFHKWHDNEGASIVYLFVTSILICSLYLIAVHLWRLSMKETDRTDELTALYGEVKDALNESERLLQILGTAFENIEESIILYDSTGHTQYRNGRSNQVPLFTLTDQAVPDTSGSLVFPQFFYMDGTPLHMANNPLTRLLNGELPDPPTPYRLRLSSDAERIIQIQVLPLLRDERLAGIMSIGRDITSDYLHERTQELLRSIAHACASASTRQDVGTAVMESLFTQLDLATAALIVADPDRPGRVQVLGLQTGVTYPDAVKEQIQSVLERAVVSREHPLSIIQVLATGVPIFDYRTPFVASTETQTYTYGYVSSVPLQDKGRCFGVLSIGFNEQYSHSLDGIERTVLLTIADELSNALIRARLYEDADRLALHDALTGLYNHRALQHHLAEFWKISGQEETSLAVIMLDVDHFRRFNETYGHDMGDRALREVARAMEAAVRTTDVVARYGGEEFTVILPQTDADEALVIAERIREMIASITLTGHDDAIPITVTASLGVALRATSITLPGGLLKAADIALYASKHSGRNKVTLYHTGMGDEENESIVASTDRRRPQRLAALSQQRAS